jgi:hypothetical protein
MAIDQAPGDELLGCQRNEITEYQIYRQLAKTIKSPENGRILEQIAEWVRALLGVIAVGVTIHILHLKTLTREVLCQLPTVLDNK